MVALVEVEVASGAGAREGGMVVGMEVAKAAVVRAVA